MELREYCPLDCQELARLFYQTVHTANAVDYTPQQLDAWADGHTDLAAWNRSFLSHYTLVAQQEDQIIGFGDICRDGYLDRLYVHRDFQGKGIATAICERLEQRFQVDRITTHAWRHAAAHPACMPMHPSQHCPFFRGGATKWCWSAKWSEKESC